MLDVLKVYFMSWQPWWNSAQFLARVSGIVKQVPSPEYLWASGWNLVKYFPVNEMAWWHVRIETVYVHMNTVEYDPVFQQLGMICAANRANVIRPDDSSLDIYWHKECEVNVLRGLIDLIRLRPLTHLGTHPIPARWGLWSSLKSRNTFTSRFLIQEGQWYSPER